MNTAQERAIGELAPWFHNLHLPGGVETAPHHPLGDFPANKWQAIADWLPGDLTGWTALDVGCNAGFYSFELARRGAQVTAVDCDPHYLRQARWAAAEYKLGERISFQQEQVYRIADGKTYDLVWFMGVFYHLRYPLLALDLLARATRRLMVFQSMTMPSEEVFATPDDFELESRHLLTQPGWPCMAFVEKRLAADPTNWWVPNHACVEAMLRTSGLRVVGRPEREIYFCEPVSQAGDDWAAYDQQFAAARERVAARQSSE